MNKKNFYARLRIIVVIICILTIGIIGELIALSIAKNSDKVKESSYVEKDSDNNDDHSETANKDPDKDSNRASEKDNTGETNENRDSVEENPYEDANDTNTSDENTDEIVMLFTGDIYLSDFILNQYDKKGVDGILSKNIQEEFQNAHIVMANEEFPFSNRGTKAKDKQFTFRIDPKYVQAFSDMMINVVTLGNNHVLDYGTQALQDTFSTLQGAKIPYVGAGNNIKEARETKYFDVGEKNIAILGASRKIPVTDWNAGENKPGLFTTYDPTALIAEIETAKAQSDYVIVYVHWGTEKENHPEEYQRKMAKQYIDAGADLVVGSHPHVLQGMEYYKGKPIIYSLGNFIFYSNNPQTALLKVTIQEDDSVKTELIPAKVEKGTTFIIEDSKEIQNFYKYMTDISYGVTFDKTGAISY